MTIEVPVQTESPEEKYEKLLLAGMETNKKYEALSESLEQEEDESVVFEDVEDEVRDTIQQMQSEMQERVGLLRQQGVPTIEEVFPRVKRSQEAEEAAQQLGELEKEMTRKLIKGVSDPNFDMNELNEMRTRAAELMERSKFQELNEQEMEQYGEALRKLAEENGYEIDGDGLGGWIGLKKDGLEFEMKHFAVPSSFGIGGYSRISKISVQKRLEDGDSEWLLSYDRGWDTATQDPVAQKEIDRVVAIFG